MPSDPTFRRLERFRRNCETVTDDDADRAVNLLVAAFPGAEVVDLHPVGPCSRCDQRTALVDENGARRCSRCRLVEEAS